MKIKAVDGPVGIWVMRHMIPKHVLPRRQTLVAILAAKV
jgi:hypothetical protein